VSDLKPGAPGDWVLTASEQVEGLQKAGVEQAKIVQSLIATCQSMEGRITDLEAKVRALTKMAFLAWHSTVTSSLDATTWAKYSKAAEELGAFESSKDILKD
jgi:hypothetical protein